MSKKKPKAVKIDGISIRPTSAAESRRIEKRIKKENENLRKRYREVHGKRVDWISHWIEEGIFFSPSGSPMGNASPLPTARR